MATPIPEPIQEQVKIDTTVGQAPFESSFSNAAMTPTMLGDLGAATAQSASNMLATQWGYQAGLTPHGDLVPPLTKADKAYQQAYMAQSSNTLSLQLNDMMLKANAQLHNLNQLTPGIITDYHQQMSEGVEQILSNAPIQLKSTLGAQYASQIQNTTHNLSIKLDNQNKARVAEHMKVVDKQTDVEIINKAMSGDLEGARKLYESKLENNKRQFESGMMAESQLYTSNETAKLSYHTAISNAKALAARKAGRGELDKYLASLADFDNKPADLTYDQYNTMGTNTLRFMQHLDRLEQNERQDIVSDLNAKLFTGALSNQDIEEAQASGLLRPADINELTAKWNRWQSSHQVAQNELLATATGFSDTLAYNAAPAKKQNEAFNSIVQSIKQKRPDAEIGTIEAEVAAIAGGPNQSFFNHLTSLSRSAVPGELERASRMYHIVNNRSPENLSGLSQGTLDNIRAFDAFRELYPADSVQATAMARNVMLPKNQDQKDANNAAWADYRRNFLSTSADRLKYAKTVLSANGLFFKPDVLSSTETSQHITNILERYTKLFNGDTEAAKTATKNAVSTIYGETHFNGKKEVAKFPIEKYSGYGNKSTFFIQHDLINSLQSQFGAYRKAFDEGRSNFFYRVKDADNWSLTGLGTTLDQAKTIKNSLDRLDTKMVQLKAKMDKGGYYGGIKYDAEFNQLQNERNDLINQLTPLQQKINGINDWSKPIQVEQVWKGEVGIEGHTETFTLSINAGDNTSFSYDTSSPIIGDYDIFLISPKGARVSIQALAGHAMLPVVYTPDFMTIRNNTANFINSSGGQTSYEEAMARYRISLQSKPKEDTLSPSTLASRGLTGELARRQFLGESND